MSWTVYRKRRKYATYPTFDQAAAVIKMLDDADNGDDCDPDGDLYMREDE